MSLSRYGLILAAVVASWLSPVGAESPDGARPLIMSNQFVLSGEVIARSESGFTILGLGSQLTVVQVGSDTAITKGAESLRLSEIMVGDKLSATVMRVADGSLRAVKVEVRTGYGD